MKRGAGYLALFAFLVAGLRLAGGPASLREGSGVQAQQRMPAPVATFLREETACHAFDSSPATVQNDTRTAADAKQNSAKHGEIARLVDQFFYRSGQTELPSVGQLPPRTRLMIATVPDPRHTHLSLQFDRTLEAIQQAAQDEGYTYDSSWLPWKAERVAYGSLNDREAEMRQAAERELCPGLVAFRRSPSLRAPANAGAPDPNTTTAKSTATPPASPDCDPYQCGLFVFIVGEVPTAGLNRVQWENALQWIDAHASSDRADKALRVLGPNFSGSMPSFVRAVNDAGSHTLHRKGLRAGEMVPAGASTFTSTLLYTGRIRGCTSWRWLQQQLIPSHENSPGALHLPVRPADFEENDALQTRPFLSLSEGSRARSAEIAILSEDETAYGGLPDAAARRRRQDPENFPCNPEYSEATGRFTSTIRAISPRSAPPIRNSRSLLPDAKSDSGRSRAPCFARNRSRRRS